MKKVTSISELEKVAGNDKNLLKELLSKFISQTEFQIIQLKQNLSAFNADEVKSIVHKMKSPFYYFGMNEQRLIAQKIEETADRDVELTKGMITEFINDCSLAIEELKELLRKIN